MIEIVMCLSVVCNSVKLKANISVGDGWCGTPLEGRRLNRVFLDFGSGNVFVFIGKRISDGTTGD